MYILSIYTFSVATYLLFSKQLSMSHSANTILLLSMHQHMDTGYGTVADNQTHPIWYLDNVIFLGKTDVGFET